MNKIRKIEVDSEGRIFHAYAVVGDKDPNSPESGLEIDVAYADLHEDIIQNIGEYREAYIYDKDKGLRRRNLNECGDAFKGKLKDFKELPSGFIKKNLNRKPRRATP